MLHTIESDTLFDVIFIDLWDPGGIPYQYGSRKILTCLDCMPGFGLGAASGLNQITSDQVTGCAFGNFFFYIWDYKNDCRVWRWNFYGMTKKTFQWTIIIPVYAVERGNHKAIRNEGFHIYLNKLKKIKSSDKSSLQQWLQ